MFAWSGAALSDCICLQNTTTDRILNVHISSFCKARPALLLFAVVSLIANSFSSSLLIGASCVHCKRSVFCAPWYGPSPSEEVIVA